MLLLTSHSHKGEVTAHKVYSGLWVIRVWFVISIAVVRKHSEKGSLFKWQNANNEYQHQLWSYQSNLSCVNLVLLLITIALRDVVIVIIIIFIYFLGLQNSTNGSLSQNTILVRWMGCWVADMWSAGRIKSLSHFVQTKSLWSDDWLVEVKPSEMFSRQS